MLQGPGRGTLQASYLSTWPGHWLFNYRSHFQIVPKKSGGCGQHQKSWSEFVFFFFQKKTEDNIWRLSIQDIVANIHDPIVSICKTPTGEVGQFILFYYFLIASCLWAEPHLNMFAIWKNLLNGLMQNSPLDSAPVVLLSARHQAQSALFVLCHQLPLLLGIIASPWLDAPIF